MGGSFEAAELLFGTQSLPEFAAHVCVERRSCESACVLTQRSEPVPIGSISRFLLDYGWKHGVKEPPPAPATGQRVVVIGSGLCGLVGADALSRLGYEVTIVDEAPRAGGRLVNGLAGFKVDKAVIERRIESLKARNVRFRLGVQCGKDVTLAELRRDFDAVLFALGRTVAVPLDVPGAELPGVCQAYPFLLQHISGANLRTPPPEVAGRRIVVLGGGDTAMDALRIAMRRGAKEALCIYRRDQANMPADPKEHANAVEEGARFLYLSQPVGIIGNRKGEVEKVRCVRTQLGAPDASGRRAPERVPGSEFEMAADVVLVAYGFVPPKLPPCADLAELTVNQHGRLVVDSRQRTNVPGGSPPVLSRAGRRPWSRSCGTLVMPPRRSTVAWRRDGAVVDKPSAGRDE